MQLVDPEDIPAMERLTQEVLLLREKVASVEPQGQEVSGNKRQQVSYWNSSSSVASTPCLPSQCQVLQEVTSAAPGILSLLSHPMPVWC